MPTKQGIIEFVQAIADTTEDNQTRITFGAPGGHLKNVIGEIRPTGQVWDEGDGVGTWPMVIDAISKAFGIRKEVTGNYSQQRQDGILGVTSIPPTGLQITLMAAAEYGEARFVTVKDESGAAGVVPKITLVVDGGGTIDEALSYVISIPLGGVTLYSGGGKWFIQF